MSETFAPGQVVRFAGGVSLETVEQTPRTAPLLVWAPQVPVTTQS